MYHKQLEEWKSKKLQVEAEIKKIKHLRKKTQSLLKKSHKKQQSVSSGLIRKGKKSLIRLSRLEKEKLKQATQKLEDINLRIEYIKK